MRWTVLILTAFLLAGSVAHAGPECPKSALLELENHHRQTMATECLEDSRWREPDGDSMEEIFGIDLVEPEVRIYDQHTAIVTGTWRVVGLQKGCRVESLRRFTHLWILADGKWRLIQEHLALE